MPRRCSICDHPKRAEIDAALLTAAYRRVALSFSLSPDATFRHRQHIAVSMAKAKAAPRAVPSAAVVKHVQREQAHAETLAEMWLGLRRKANSLLATAERRKDTRTQLGAIRELTRLAELGFRASAELNRNDSSAALHEHRDWPAHVQALLDALRDHPRALDALRSAFAQEGAA